MNKPKILLFIPLAVVAGFLIYTWWQIMFVTHWATWRHYTGLILFVAVLYLMFTNFKIAVVAAGVYLIIGTLNLLSITQDVLLYEGVQIISVKIGTSFFQGKLFLIFLLYFFLNFDTLVNIRLDYLEEKEVKKK